VFVYCWWADTDMHLRRSKLQLAALAAVYDVLSGTAAACKLLLTAPPCVAARL